MQSANTWRRSSRRYGPMIIGLGSLPYITEHVPIVLSGSLFLTLMHFFARYGQCLAAATAFQSVGSLDPVEEPYNSNTLFIIGVYISLLRVAGKTQKCRFLLISVPASARHRTLYPCRRMDPRPCHWVDTLPGWVFCKGLRGKARSARYDSACLQARCPIHHSAYYPWGDT